jgi:hypothetical protein
VCPLLNTECPALNDSKIEHYTYIYICIYLTIKFTVEIGILSNTDLAKFLMCPVDLNIGTISGTTHTSR